MPVSTRDLADRIQFAVGFIHADLAAAAQVGDWVSLARFDRVHILLITSIGIATEDPQIHVEEADDVAGTSAANLAVITKGDMKQGVDLTDSTDLEVQLFTRATQAASHLFPSGANIAHGEEQSITLVTIEKSQLTVGATAIRAKFADVGATEQRATLLYLLEGPSELVMPTAIID